TLTGVLVATMRDHQGQDPGARLFNGLRCQGRSRLQKRAAPPQSPARLPATESASSTTRRQRPNPAPRRTGSRFSRSRDAPTGDIWLFRITDHRAGPATEVSLAAQGCVVDADGRRCTWMYETRNETAQALPALNPRCQWRTGFVMHPADVFLSRCLRHALQLCAGSSAASGCLAVGRPGWLLLAPLRLPGLPASA